MKNLIILVFLIATFELFAVAPNLNASLTSARYNNGHPFQGSFSCESTTYNDATISSATDLTGAAITAKAVRICAFSKGIHYKWSNDATSATSTDMLIMPNTCETHIVDSNTNRLTVIEESASAEVFMCPLR